MADGRSRRSPSSELPVAFRIGKQTLQKEDIFEFTFPIEKTREKKKYYKEIRVIRQSWGSVNDDG